MRTEAADYMAASNIHLAASEMFLQRFYLFFSFFWLLGANAGATSSCASCVNTLLDGGAATISWHHASTFSSFSLFNLFDPADEHTHILPAASRAVYKYLTGAILA